MNDIHTKYRPTKLEQVVGQGHVVKSLRAVLKKETCRAFIFSGPSGCGKTTIARIVAAEVGCSPKNIVEVDAATNTGIDAIRAITGNLIYSAIGTSPGKMVILDETHMLSRAAFTSLLKVVEEPPANTYFAFCTTEDLKIPVAIRNRCTQYRLKKVEIDTLHALLTDISASEEFGTPDEVLYFLAEKADGSPRQALTSLAQCAGCKTRKEAGELLATAMEEGEAIDLAKALAKGVDWAQAMKLVQKLEGVNPESVRILVVNYFCKAAIGARSDEQASKACAILDAFSTPYPTGTSSVPLVLSLGQLLL